MLVTGLAVFGTVSTTHVAHASNLVSARQSGVLRLWPMSLLPRWCLFTGRIAATVLLADTSALVTRDRRTFRRNPDKRPLAAGRVPNDHPRRARVVHDRHGRNTR